MRKEQAEDFLDSNKEAFNELGKLIRLATDARYIKDGDDLMVKKQAVEMVETWISELFNIKMGDIVDKLSEEEDNIYIRRKKESRELSS